MKPKGSSIRTSLHQLDKQGVAAVQKMAICVMCSEEFDSLKVTFEQRLIDDTDFCVKCWTEIMDGEYDTDLDFNLAEITQKRREG